MSGRTPRFGLTILDQPGEGFDHDSWRFGTRDRRLIDRVLAHLAEGHHHDGLWSGEDPLEDLEVLVERPTVEGASTAGLIGPGDQVYYRYALVDRDGMEGPASNVAVVHTPSQVPAPPIPTVSSVGEVGGDGSFASQLGGVYHYAVSYWTADSRCETQASPVAVLRDSSELGSTVHRVDIGVLDPAADGWNLYRKGPVDTEWWLWASTEAVSNYSTPWLNPPPTYLEVSGPAVWHPDWEQDVVPVPRPLPTTNNTNTRLTVRVTPPVVRAEYVWRLYRTFDPSNWEDSLIAQTGAGDFLDKGTPGKPGSPTDSPDAVRSPPPIDLDDAAEVEGVLPPGRVLTPVQAQLLVEGSLTPGYGRFIWVSEFEWAFISRVHPRLLGGPPDVQDVIGSIERRAFFGTSWTELESCRFVIPQGEQEAEPFDTLEWPRTAELIEMGDALRVVIIQDGGGAATDVDLALGLVILARSGSETQTYVWSV